MKWEKKGDAMKYEIIYADFPWPWYTDFGTAKIPYPLMTEQECVDFPFEQYMAKKCVLFLWMTGPFFIRQSVMMHGWSQKYGLRELGIPYIWIKTTKAGVPIKAAGPRAGASGVKPQGEFVAALTNTKRGRTFPLMKENETQWLYEGGTEEIYAPKVLPGEHSRKPAETRDRIVGTLGDRPRVELFSREEIAGWDGHGNQYPGKALLPLQAGGGGKKP